MPRRRVQKLPCDCVECREVFLADSRISEYIARQKVTPKCLVLFVPNYIEGNTRETGEKGFKYEHLTAVQRAGCSGILALRGGEATGKTSSWLALENLFCKVPVNQLPTGKGAEERGAAFRSLAAELVTDSEEVRRVAHGAGFTAIHRLEDVLQTQSTKPDESQNVEALAAYIIAKLDVESRRKQLEDPDAAGQAYKEESEDHPDLLFLCLESAADSCGHPETLAEDSGHVRPAGGLEKADKLLRALDKVPGFYETVLLVLLFEVCDLSLALLPQTGGGLLQESEQAVGYEGITRPRQSYEFAGLDSVTIDRTKAILSIQRLPHVIRMDHEQHLPGPTEEFRPGNGCILAERLMPEIAYKLGCAPKYGA